MTTLATATLAGPAVTAPVHRQIRVSLSIQPDLQPVLERWLRSTGNRRCLRLHACHRRRAQAPWVLYLDVSRHRYGELVHWLRRLRRRSGVRQVNWESLPA